MLRCINISFISINLERSSVGRRPSALCKKYPYHKSLLLERQMAQETKFFTITQIFDLGSSLSSHFASIFFNGNYNTTNLNYILLNVFDFFLKFGIWIWIWSEHHLELLPQVKNPGFYSKCDVSPLLILRVIQLQLSSFLALLKNVLFPNQAPLAYKESQVKRGHYLNHNPLLQWFHLLSILPHNCSTWKPESAHHELLTLILNIVSIIHPSALSGTSKWSQSLWPYNSPSESFKEVTFVRVRRTSTGLICPGQPHLGPQPMHSLAHSPGIPTSAQAQGTSLSYSIRVSVSTPFLDVSESLAVISYLDLGPDLLPCLQLGK